MAILEVPLIAFYNRYRSPYIKPNPQLKPSQRQRLKAAPLILGAQQRKSVELVRETCDTASGRYRRLMSDKSCAHGGYSESETRAGAQRAFKANATRLRQDGLWSYEFSPWADKGSKVRGCGTNKSVVRAIDYVLNGQGNDLPDFDD